MFEQLFRAIVKIFLAAVFLILAVSSLLSVVLIATAWYMGSFWGVLIYCYSLAVFVFAFIVCLQKRFRENAAKSATMRWPLFMGSLVAGTAAGMVVASLWLPTGNPSHALPSLLLFSLGVPVFSLLMEYLGLDLGPD